MGLWVKTSFFVGFISSPSNDVYVQKAGLAGGATKAEMSQRRTWEPGSYYNR